MTLNMKQRLVVAAIVELERQRKSHPHWLKLAGFTSMMHIDGTVNLEDLIEALLDTLREPDDPMHEAGAAVVDQGQGHPHDKPLPTLRNAFTAMIDTARAQERRP